MKELEAFIQSKIDGYIEVLQIVMTKENVNEITYGDKLCAIGGLNMAVAVMKEIKPDFKFDLCDYFPEVNSTKHMSKR